MRKKEIRIEPFDKKSVGTASIDLSLGDQIRVFKKTKNNILLSENNDYKKYSKIISIRKGYS